MNRAVTMRAGSVWRPTLDSVLVCPRDAPPFTVDRRSGEVIAVLDRARPEAVDAARLLDALGTEGDPPPSNGAEWLETLLELLESVGMVSIVPSMDDGGP